MKKAIVFVFMITIMFALCSCKINSYAFTKLYFYNYFDTNLEIIIEFNQKETTTKEINNQITPNVEHILQNLEKEFAGEESSVPNSTVKKLNNLSGKEGLEVSDDFLFVLNKGLSISKISPKFDLTIGTISCLWKQATQLPKIDEELLKLTNSENVKIEANIVSLLKEGVKLDFGAIAKGYAVDKIKEYLDTLNYTFYLINFGGNVYISDVDKLINKEDIEKAIVLDNIYVAVQTSNKHIVTTNDFNRYVIIDDVKYGHVLDATTGFPVETDILTVTIFADSSLDGDCASTLCYLLGYEEAKKYIEKENMQALIVTNDNIIHNIGNVKYEKIEV